MIKPFLFTLEGPIPSKKNRWRISRKGGVYIPGDVRDQLEDLLWQLQQIKMRKKLSKPMIGKLSVQVSFPEGREDLDNQVTTLLDLLQKSGIIKNDKYVVKIDAAKIKVEDEKVSVKIEIIG